MGTHALGGEPDLLISTSHDVHDVHDAAPALSAADRVCDIHTYTHTHICGKNVQTYIGPGLRSVQEQVRSHFGSSH